MVTVFIKNKDFTLLDGFIFIVIWALGFKQRGLIIGFQVLTGMGVTGANQFF